LRQQRRDAAEEEAFKEALLAYLFFARSGKGLTRRQLDEAVESWLEKEWAPRCRAPRIDEETISA
jgi:hypothetical protein